VDNKVTIRSIIISLIGVFISVLWIRSSEVLATRCQITESVVPITAMTMIMFLVLLNPILQFIGKKFSLPANELVLIYTFITIGSVMSGIGITQAFLPYLVVPFYYAEPTNKFAEMQQYLPSWLGPRDPETIRGFFEGSFNGIVPWEHWVGPLAFWLLFFVLFWWVATCIWAVMRKQWAETEHLGFPLINIPYSIITEKSIEGKDDTAVPFFKNKLMWAGFAIAGLYQLTNMLNAIDPTIPCIGWSYSFNKILTEFPWKNIANTTIYYRPELVGLGYLIPAEILLSIVIFYWIENFLCVFGYAMHIATPGFPHNLQQSLGGYLALIVMIIWISRRHLKIALKKAIFNTPEIDDSKEPLPYRIAVFGGIAGFIAIILFCAAAGIAWWVATGFFLLIFGTLFIYGRIRAETGIPSQWIYPHTIIRQSPFYVFGIDAFKIGGTLQTLSALPMFFFLANGGFFTQSTVYQLESYQLADKTGFSKRIMTWVGISAMLIGLILAFWIYLSTYYQYGLNTLANQRLAYCLTSYTEISKMLQLPSSNNPLLITWTVIGFIITLILSFIRQYVSSGFILNPIGYVVATTYGYNLWSAFFAAWIAKVLIMRMGGIKLYRKFIPFFLGLAIGTFFLTGVLWPIIAAFFKGVRYHVWFV